jgi:hypothetical protein
MESLPDGVDTEKVRGWINAIGDPESNRILSGKSFSGLEFPNSLLTSLVSSGALVNLGGGSYAIDTKNPNKQLARDMIAIYQIINSGVPKETAKQILTKAIEQARYDAAAKDWAP